MLQIIPKGTKVGAYKGVMQICFISGYFDLRDFKYKKILYLESIRKDVDPSAIFWMTYSDLKEEDVWDSSSISKNKSKEEIEYIKSQFKDIRESVIDKYKETSEKALKMMEFGEYKGNAGIEFIRKPMPKFARYLKDIEPYKKEENEKRAKKLIEKVDKYMAEYAEFFV